jgi:hypothetical protein
MAELADAADSKSADPCDRGGSTPPPGTTDNKGVTVSQSDLAVTPKKLRGPFGGRLFPEIYHSIRPAAGHTSNCGRHR